MTGFWHVAEIQIVRKVEVDKAATHVSRQEHNSGCVYVRIKASSLSGIEATIENSLKIS